MIPATFFLLGVICASFLRGDDDRTASGIIATLCLIGIGIYALGKASA